MENVTYFETATPEYIIRAEINKKNLINLLDKNDDLINLSDGLFKIGFNDDLDLFDVAEANKLAVKRNYEIIGIEEYEDILVEQDKYGISNKVFEIRKILELNN